MQKDRLLKRMVATVAMAVTMLLSFPAPALAAFPSFVKDSGKYASNITSISANEQQAYKRALAAAMDYENQANPIEVNVSDLNLTSAQAEHVQRLLHSNGELFWIDTDTCDNFTASTLKLRCRWDDETITSMRAEVDAAYKKALKRVSSNMDAATKILTLHDYLIDTIDYVDHARTAYTGLVSHKANCFGYALTMDLVLRRLGYETDMAYDYSDEHTWNLVKLSGNWYHIDLTWDHGFTLDDMYWECLGQDGRKGKHCHIYLLQTDYRMKSDVYRGYTGFTHGRWWAHHHCTAKTYSNEVGLKSTIFAENKYKLYVNGFTVGGLKYKAYGSSGKCTLAAVTSATKKTAAVINIPSTVTYKGLTYKVVGLDKSAFANTKAKTIGLYSTYCAASRIKGCLSGSKVKTIKLKGAATAKKSAYKKMFTKSNTGASSTLKLV